MYASWVVAVAIRASYSGNAAFQKLRSDSTAAESSVGRLTAKHVEMAQKVAMGAGLIGAAFYDWSAHGIKAAGDYQMKLLELQNSAGLTAKQMDGMKASIIAANLRTGQNLNQTTSEYTAAIQHGLTPEQLLKKDKTGQDLGMILAQYAHIQSLYHGIDPTTSVTSAVMFAHQQGVYDPEGIKQITEALNKLSMSSGATQSQVLTQGGYFIQLARRMGMTVDQSMHVLEQLSISGLLRNKGGAGMADLILGITQAPAGNAFLESKKAPALTELGLYDKHGKSKVMGADGKINFTKLMEILNFDAIHMPPATFAADLKALGGIPGMRAALQMTNPASQQQEKLLRDKESRIPTIVSMVDQTYGTWNGAMQLLQSNLSTFTTLFWTPFVNQFSWGLKALSNVVGGATLLIQKFPRATLLASTALLGASVVAIGLGVASAISSFFKLEASLATLANVARGVAVENDVTAVAGGAGAAVEGEAAVAGIARRGILGKILGGIGVAALAPWKATGKLLKPVTAPIGRLGEAARDSWRAGVSKTAKFGVTPEFMSGFWADLRRSFAGLTGPVEEFVMHMGGVGRMLLEFGGIFGRIGLNFIPVIGVIVDVISVIQLASMAFNFFKQHPKDIGTWIGNILGYLKYKLLPESIKVVESWGPAIGQAFQSLWQWITGALNPANWKANIGSFGDAWNKMIAQAKATMDKQDPSRYQHTKPGGGGSGNTVVQHNKIVVNGAKDPVAVGKEVHRQAERAAARGVATNGGRSTSPYRPQVNN